MTINQLSDNTHDVLSLSGRIVNFYRFFNRQDWLRCHHYIDPKLQSQSAVSLADYSRSMQTFFEEYGPIQDVRIVKLNIHAGSQAKADRREFAYLVISWKDKKNQFHHFKERWIKDRDKWFTRVVGLVPTPAEF